MDRIEDLQNLIKLRRKQSASGDDVFDVIPVSPKEFFKNWLKPELSQPQLEAVEAIFDNEEGGTEWSEKYNEFLLLWGEGSGKDFLCSRILVYVAYFLMCMRSPQKFFGMAPSEPIDLVNVSLSGRHAKNVFFYKFKQALRQVQNPKTGKNWFEEQGMDLKDGKDVQTLSVEFKKGIRAHSLNSQTYGGEGMNVLVTVFDEVAEFKVIDAKNLYNALKFTQTSRYGEKFKLFLISYMRHENDFMMYRWDKTKKDPKVYRSKKATWEVNPNKTKADFQKRYDEDPEDSSRRFENKNLKVHENRFFQYPEKIKEHVSKIRKCPFILKDEIYCDDLASLEFQNWFRPKVTQELYHLLRKGHKVSYDEEQRRNLLFEQHRYASYYLHLDLAKANVDKKNDCAGFSMVHRYLLNPFKNYESDYDDEIEYGVYVDFMLQLRGKPELNFESIRQFIYKLQNIGFPIAKVTLDGWQSLDFQQQLIAKGIESDIISVDKSRDPYNTLKRLLYGNRLEYYFYQVFDRELRELEDIDGKIDHPEVSRERALTEGLEYGSKDVSDSVAGATFSCLKSQSDGSDSDWIGVSL